MKTITKWMICAVYFSFIFSASNAQEVAMLGKALGTGEVAKTPAPAATAAGAEMTIQIKNTAATDIYVFAGPKEEIRKPRIQTFGGYSKNTLYLTVNDVVCLMNTEVKPKACAVVKPGTTRLEVDPSGDTITSK